MPRPPKSRAPSPKPRTASADAADERILSLLLLLLDTAQPLSREEIFRAIPTYLTRAPAAGDRKFERDKKDLRAMGVPIDQEGVGPYTYRVDPKAYALPAVHLDEEEQGALVLAAEALRSTGGLAYRDLVDEALRKLSFDTNLAGRKATTRLLGITLPTRTVTARLRRLVATLSAAVEGRKQVTLTYASGTNGEDSVRTISPYAVVYSAGDWLLIGHCHLRGAPRTFRVDRILKLKVAGRPGTPDFERPADWNLSTYVQRSPWAFQAGGDNPTQVVLDVGPERSWVADEDFGKGYRQAPLEDNVRGEKGWTRIQFASGNLDYVAKRVLDGGGHLRIVEPISLRRRIEGQAAAVAAVYAASGANP